MLIHPPGVPGEEGGAGCEKGEHWAPECLCPFLSGGHAGPGISPQAPEQNPLHRPTGAPQGLSTEGTAPGQ